MSESDVSVSSPARAAQPSYVVLPRQTGIHPEYQTVLGFLIGHFPQISAAEWQQRVTDGKVHWQNGDLIDELTPYQATVRVYYYREVV